MFLHIFIISLCCHFGNCSKSFGKIAKIKKAEKIYRSPRFPWQGDEIIVLQAQPTAALTIEHKRIS